MTVKAAPSRRNDALSTVAWGAGLLWGGLVWLLHETGVLAAFPGAVDPAALFFLGFGLILAVAIAITLLVPGFKHASFFAYALAALSIGAGLGGWTYAWPAVLAAGGVVLIVSATRQLGGTD